MIKAIVLVLALELLLQTSVSAQSDTARGADSSASISADLVVNGSPSTPEIQTLAFELLGASSLFYGSWYALGADKLVTGENPNMYATLVVVAAPIGALIGSEVSESRSGDLLLSLASQLAGMLAAKGLQELVLESHQRTPRSNFAYLSVGAILGAVIANHLTLSDD